MSPLALVRARSFRNATNRLVEAINRQFLRGVVSSPEVYEAQVETMRKNGVEVDDAVDYDRMLDFVERDEYSIRTPQDFTLGAMLQSFCLAGVEFINIGIGDKERIGIPECQEEAAHTFQNGFG